MSRSALPRAMDALNLTLALQGIKRYCTRATPCSPLPAETSACSCAGSIALTCPLVDPLACPLGRPASPNPVSQIFFTADDLPPNLTGNWQLVRLSPGRDHPIALRVILPVTGEAKGCDVFSRSTLAAQNRTPGSGPPAAGIALRGSKSQGSGSGRERDRRDTSARITH